MYRASNARAVALLGVFALFFTLSSAMAQTQTADDIVGEWEFKLDMGGQEIFSTVVFSKKADGSLTGTWTSSRGEDELTNVVFMNGNLTFDRTASMGGETFELSFEGTHKDGKIEGYLYAEMGEIFTTAVKKAPPVKLEGEWEMTMQFGQRGGRGGGGGQGQQRAPSKVVFNKSAAGAFTGEWTGGFGMRGGMRGGQRQGQQRQGAGQMQTALSDIKLVNDKLTFVRKMGSGERQFSMAFAGTIVGDKITGEFTMNMGQRGGGEAMQMPATLTRVKAKPIPAAVGDWEIKMSFGEREMTSTLSFTQKEDGSLTGKWSSERGDTELTDVKFEGDQLTFTQTRTMGEREIVSTFTGTVKGDDLTGAMTFGEYEVPITGKRKK